MPVLPNLTIEYVDYAASERMNVRLAIVWRYAAELSLRGFTSFAFWLSKCVIVSLFLLRLQHQ